MFVKARTERNGLWHSYIWLLKALALPVSLHTTSALLLTSTTGRPPEEEFHARDLKTASFLLFCQGKRKLSLSHTHKVATQHPQTSVAQLLNVSIVGYGQS